MLRVSSPYWKRCPSYARTVIFWLLAEGLLKLNDKAANKFWAHHETVQADWLLKAPHEKDGYVVHPVSIYGDEAEYTQTKQKILTIYISFPLWDDEKSLFVVPASPSSL